MTLGDGIKNIDVYKRQAMSFMTELFDRATVKYYTIPFEEQTYSKYLEALVNCSVSLNGYSKTVSYTHLSETGWNETAGVNEPKLSEGMIPVYYDEVAGKWKKADASNTGTNKWYDYNTKQWANIATVSNDVNTTKQYRTAVVDTIIEMEDITAMFVWIPRYSYSITAVSYTHLDVYKRQIFQLDQEGDQEQVPF